MICSNCKTDNNDNAKYCKSCGCALIQKNPFADGFSELKIELLEKKMEKQFAQMEKQIAQLERNMATYFRIPIIIKSLKVGNIYYNMDIQTEHGEKLYSDSTMYLSPKIEYFGLYESAMTLNLKLFREGILQYNPKISPSGYTSGYSGSFEVKEGVKILEGWGQSEKGYWTAGNYRYEIWYNDICLKAVDFKIY